ncbi:hypothetical protein KP509_1Z072200 [Ceratopteris richardii]|nr:hypothetical protein KP509_1Z072200 [Ceratopteris richardii]
MAPTPLKNLLTAFSPRGDYLALCVGDGRIKIWDTVSGSVKGDFSELISTNGVQSISSDGHLAVDYTCMAWNPLMKKGKKRHGASFLIGLGTGSGDIILIDAALGKLKWKVQDCHTGGVKSITFGKSGSIIYSAGSDGMVCELHVDTGELLGKLKASKRAVSSITVSGDGKYLLAGSGDLRLLDLNTRKRVCKFTGHPGTVKSLVYTADDCYFLSSADGERHIAMWHYDGSKKVLAASCSLSIEHPAISVDCSGGFPGNMQILAVSEVGIAYIWDATCIKEVSEAQPIKIKLADDKNGGSTFNKNTRSFKPAILAAKFLGRTDKGAGSVLIVFGTTVKPRFERINLDGKDNEILLHFDDTGALITQIQSRKQILNKNVSGAVILGPDNAVDVDKLKVQVELDDAAIKPSKKKKRAPGGENEKSISDDAKGHSINRTESMDVCNDGEETMEEKLKALGIMTDGGEDGEVKKDMVVPLKADSLQVLMQQALESDDKVLLKQCLSVTDNKVIVKTVRMLNSSLAVKFLQMSVHQLHSKTGRALILVPWIRAILLYHASFVMSNSSIQPALSSLYQVIDSRLSVFRPLLSLSGRLDLVMAQVANTSASQQQEVAAAIVYEESDAEDGEVEDAMNVDMEEEDSDESVEDLIEGNAVLNHLHGNGLLEVDMGNSDGDDF